MKRIFCHYEKWEDWRDGLYRKTLDKAEEILVSRAARLLCDTHSLLKSMRDVVERWPNASAVNLSNRSRNRQAWLGQAACCFVCGAPEDLTKTAWHRLTGAEQIAANAIADQVIAEWERAQCLSDQ